MTIHIHINDKRAENQLAEMAAQHNKTIEEQASEWLINSLRERETKLQKLREKLAVGEAQLDRGECITLNGKEELHQFFEDVKKRGRERTQQEEL